MIGGRAMEPDEWEEGPMSPEVRELARELADRAGVPLVDWLAEAVDERVAEERESARWN
jgi:hypothetical protein